MLLEAIPPLKQSLNRADKAHLLAKQYLQGSFEVEYIDQETQNKAAEMFNTTASKQNTIFDCVIVL